MNALPVLGLRILLVLLFASALIAQVVLIPQTALQITHFYPKKAYLELPYAVCGIAAVACGQVAIVALWALLARVRRGAIFTDRAFRWVDVIIWCGLIATVIILGVGVDSTVHAHIGNPATVVAFAGTVITGLAFVLLMLVMRGLLRSATALQSELEEVV